MMELAGLLIAAPLHVAQPQRLPPMPIHHSAPFCADLKIDPDDPGRYYETTFEAGNAANPIICTELMDRQQKQDGRVCKVQMRCDS